MADATPTPETGSTDSTAETDTADITDQAATDWQEKAKELEAEAEKWKAQSRKNEDRAKENKKARDELDALHKASMSDTDRAIAEAREAGRSEALSTAGARLVDADIRVAAAGRTVDVDALLEGLDRSKFLTDDGEPDSDAIKAWVDRIAPAQAEQEEGPLGSGLDLGQGSRQSTPIGDDAAFTRMLTDLVK